MIRAIRHFVLFLAAAFLLLPIADAQSSSQRRKAKTTTNTTKAKPATGPDRKVAGTLVDSETGESLPFSNVFVRGTLIGVQTDLDGRFAVSVPAAYDTLRFSAMGYDPQFRVLSQLKGKTDSLVIKMRPDNIAIDEILVRPDDAPRRLLKAVIANKERNNPVNHDRAE